MKLRDVIEALEALDPDLPMQKPLQFGSWRGRYNELTIYPKWIAKEEHPDQTVGDLLAEARAADGATFMGYKGGDYVMNLDTPVWADDYGICRGMAPSGFVVRRGKVRMTTIDLSDYVYS